eukprot:jgi/Botrbrau1/19129/Bobra.0077s0041.1
MHVSGIRGTGRDARASVQSDIRNFQAKHAATPLRFTSHLILDNLMDRVGQCGSLRSMQVREGRYLGVQSCSAVHMRVASVRRSQQTHCSLNCNNQLELRRSFTGHRGLVAAARKQRSDQRSPCDTRSRSFQVFARRDAEVDIGDRIISSLPYLIPLFDGLKYGKFIFQQYPGFARLLAPLDPLVRLYYTIPFAGLICFFAIYAGIVNNRNFSRYVRYNAMQSILLDIILILPSLVENIFRPPMSGPGLQIYITGYNTVWVFVFASVVYAVGSCMAGLVPRIPLVADSADQQVM